MAKWTKNLFLANCLKKANWQPCRKVLSRSFEKNKKRTIEYDNMFKWHLRTCFSADQIIAESRVFFRKERRNTFNLKNQLMVYQSCKVCKRMWTSLINSIKLGNGGLSLGSSQFCQCTSCLKLWCLLYEW